MAVLCALALCLVGLAHRPASAGQRATEARIAAFLAAGGTLDDACLSGDADGQGAPHAECPACTLGKGMAMPAALPGPSRSPAFSAAPAFCPAAPVLPRTGARAPPATGPPALPLI